MKCRQFRFLIDEYLDRQLADDVVSEFDYHKNHCLECKKILNARVRLFQLLNEQAQETWSVDLTESVMNSIQSAPVPAASSIFKVPIIIAVATGLSVWILVLLLGLGSAITNIPVQDIIRAMTDSLDLPPEFYNSLSELIALFKGIWIGFKAIAGFLLQPIVRFIVSQPYVSIPTILIVLTFGGISLLHRIRSRKKLIV